MAEPLPWYGTEYEDPFIPLMRDIRTHDFREDCRDCDVLERWRFREDEYFLSEEIR